MLKDYSGDVYGYIEVLKMTNKRKNGYVVYECKCNKCGRIFESSLSYFKKRVNAKSNIITCGCYDRHYCNFYKNGLSNTKLRYIYDNMKARCLKINNDCYNNYGGRGIKICDEWLDKENGFINFYNWAIDNGYKEDLTIDRIDVNGDYEPNNCRWVDFYTQMNNRTNTVKLEYKGVTKTLTQWAREYNIPIVTLRSRIYRGWDIERALNEKPHKNFGNRQHSQKFLKYNILELLNE